MSGIKINCIKIYASSTRVIRPSDFGTGPWYKIQGNTVIVGLVIIDKLKLVFLVDKAEFENKFNLIKLVQ